MPTTSLRAPARVFRAIPPRWVSCRKCTVVSTPVPRSPGGPPTSRGEAVRYSRAVQAVPQSGIREVMELARPVEDAIHLEVGEPSFPTPPHVVEAAARAARDGWTRYVSSAGIPRLREAIAEKLRKHNRLEVDPGPAWPNFRMIAGLLHAPERLYPLRPDQGFLPAVEDLERLCGPRTRAVLVNSPSNPLGTIVPADRLRAVLAFAEERDLWVISDECYDQVTFDDSFASAGSLGLPEIGRAAC